MLFQEDDATEFDPTPWGSRQRMLPPSTFNAKTKRSAIRPMMQPVITPPAIRPAIDPPRPPSGARRGPAKPDLAIKPPLDATAPSLAALVAQHAVPTRSSQVVVREVDVPTWRIPKQIPAKRRVDLRLWLPIGGLLSLIVIALLGAQLTHADVRADATSISVAMLGETSEGRFQIVANVEAPVAPPVVETPPIAKPKHASVVKHAPKRSGDRR